MHRAEEPRRPSRRLAQLDATSAERFERSVLPIVNRVERVLGPEVLAERMWYSRKPRAVGSIERQPWIPARIAWHRWIHQGVHASTTRAVVTFDVRTCYPSIQPSVVDAALRRIDVHGSRRRDIAAALDEVGGVDGLAGLPIGPPASAALANLVLTGLDDALRDLGLPFRRWVDDVIVMAPSVRSAQDALSVLFAQLARLSLEPHPAKTMIADAPEAALAITRGRPSCRMRRPVG